MKKENSVIISGVTWAYLLTFDVSTLRETEDVDVSSKIDFFLFMEYLFFCHYAIGIRGDTA